MRLERLTKFRWHLLVAVYGTRETSPNPAERVRCARRTDASHADQHRAPTGFAPWRIEAKAFGAPRPLDPEVRLLHIEMRRRPVECLSFPGTRLSCGKGEFFGQSVELLRGDEYGRSHIHGASHCYPKQPIVLPRWSRAA